MIIKGQLHRITNPNEFTASYLATDGKPTVGFKKWGRARLHLATDIPSGKFPEDGSFIPTVSLKSNADSNGKFSFEVDDKLGEFRAYVIAYEQVATINNLPGVAPVPIFAPIYRSQTFKLKDMTADLRKIYVYQARSEAGFSQSQVDKEASKFKRDRGFDRVKATIKENYVSCRVEERGAEATFNINPRPSTSHDLNNFVDLKVKDLDIDLPGPDFIVGLCVDEDDIERQLRKGVAELSEFLNSIILDAIPAALRSLASATVHEIRLPVTGHKKVKVSPKAEVEVPTRSIVPDVSIGIPRKLH